MSRTFIYARVSTSEQHADNQIHEIEAAGFSVNERRIVTESISGSVAASERPQFSRLLDRLEPDDVLIVTKLDRLGRNAMDVRATVERFREDRETIADLRLQAPSGAWVRLGDVAEVSIASGPPQVRRDDVQRRVVIQANVQGRDMGSVVADIRQAIVEQVDLPTGYSVDIGGQFENQQRAQKRLALVVPVSLGLIALLLYFAFASVGQAMLILVNVPLAVIGGVFSLWISGQYLSVPSSVGFITLFGVAVLNGVVMVESINQRIANGLKVSDAVFDGAVSRLRPVLMTAITSALGLIPMLLSNGVGAEIQKPLASVIVGGLVTATFLTLFVLPVLFAWFSKGKLSDMA